MGYAVRLNSMIPNTVLLMATIASTADCVILVIKNKPECLMESPNGTPYCKDEPEP